MTPEITRLSNGFTVASLAMPGVETAAVGLNANVGARHETDHENGLAHLFEHMLFKGTATRTARRIAEEIEDVGGGLNAWTSRDMTVFHGRILADDLPLATEMIADLVNAPLFDADDLEREKAVVLSEIGEAFDTPDDLVFDLLQERCYPDQSIGRPILGTEISLAGLDRAALVRWRDVHYRADALVLAAAGRVDHAALVRQAEALFGALPSSAAEAAPKSNWVGGSAGEARKSEQMHLTLAFEGPHSKAPDYYAAQLYATALGGGMSSRLFQELREERGLAYSISASHSPHADSGVLSLYCATRPKDAAKALALARDVMAQTAATLDEAELKRAKAQLKAGLLMALESCGGQADWLGRSMLVFGRVIPASEMIADIEAADVELVRATGAKMLASPPAFAAVGPKADALAAKALA